MKKLPILLLVIVVAGSSCKKREYPPEDVQLQNSSVYFSGYFGGEPIAMSVGTDGYYCYTSFRQLADSIYLLTGELKRYECNPCTQTLRIDLTDYRKRLPGASVDVDSTFR